MTTDSPAYVPSPAALRVATGFKALAALTYVLLVFGATVRVHGAGLSCPDWPLCFGELIPQLNFQVFLEWGHRVLAGSISIGFLALGGMVLASSELRARAGGLVFAAVAALAVQIVLGGLTVLHLLAFWSVTLHLLTGNLFFAILVSLAMRLGRASSPVPAASSTRLALGASLAMWVVQMALGGLVSSNYAGLACTEWPSCNGGVWFPTFTGIVGLQVVHRLGAYTLAGLVAWLFVAGRRDDEARGGVTLALVLVLVQITLGISNVLLAMPVELAIAHSAVGDLIGLTLVVTAWRVFPRPVAAPAPVAVRGDVLAGRT